MEPVFETNHDGRVPEMIAACAATVLKEATSTIPIVFAPLCFSVTSAGSPLP
jgi:hypothetical protein